MQIITGFTGENHVTSADDASLYRGIVGIDDYVLDVGNKFEASIIDNNTVRIMDGDLLIQGHQGRIRENDYNEVIIDNGTPGQKRNDLIVARYFKDTITGIESIALEVVKGTPGTTAVDPTITREDLKIGGTQRDFALYRISIDGISLQNVTSLFSVIPSTASHSAESASEDNPHDINRRFGNFQLILEEAGSPSYDTSVDGVNPAYFVVAIGTNSNSSYAGIVFARNALVTDLWKGSLMSVTMTGTSINCNSTGTSYWTIYRVK